MTNKDTEKLFLNTLEQHIGIIVKIAGAYAHANEERKDLIQDIILELWKSFKRFDGSCKVSTWIYRVSLNTSMNYKRKQNNSSFSMSINDFREKEVVLWLTEQNNVSELEILYSSIEELNEISKMIVLLYLDGNSHEEISEITGLSKTNVGTRIGRIKEELKRIAHSKEQ